MPRPKTEDDDIDDFLDEGGDAGDKGHAPLFSDDAEVDLSPTSAPDKVDRQKPAIDIEIVDDTPEPDRGKWVANDEKDGAPDFANEDEIKNYSEDVQKRIKKYTARTHAERRRAEEADRQLEEARRMMASLLERNNQLSDLVENGEKVLIGEHKGRLQSQLAAAKQFYREAHEAGDPNGMAQAQEQIAMAAAALDRLTTHQPIRLERADQSFLDRAMPMPQPQVVEPSEATLDWRDRNASWFGRDMAMTAYALGVHQQMTTEGVRAESKEYWRRLDTELKARFPERFNGGGRRDPQRRSIVAPATRTGGGAPQKVTLSETQVKLAKRLGLTTEQYATQVLRDRQAR